MIYLNLLPPQEKKLIRLVILDRLANYYLLAIASSVVFLVILFLGVKYFLIWRVNIVKENIIVENNNGLAWEIKALEDKIKYDNGILALLKSVNDKNVNFTIILDDIFSIVPAGVYFNNLSYNSGARQFIVSGKAVTRDGLIDFVEKLKLSPYLKDVDSPPSNLVKKENLDFNVTFRLTTHNP